MTKDEVYQRLLSAVKHHVQKAGEDIFKEAYEDIMENVHESIQQGYDEAYNEAQLNIESGINKLLSGLNNL